MISPSRWAHKFSAVVVDHFPPGPHDQEMWLDWLCFVWPLAQSCPVWLDLLPPTSIAQGFIWVNKPPYHDKLTVHKEGVVALQTFNVWANVFLLNTCMYTDARACCQQSAKRTIPTLAVDSFVRPAAWTLVTIVKLLAKAGILAWIWQTQFVGYKNKLVNWTMHTNV